MRRPLQLQRTKSGAFLIAILALLACADATAPNKRAAVIEWEDGKPSLVGDGVHTFEIPPGFSEDDRLVLQGTKRPDGACVYRSTFETRIGSARSGKLRRVDEVPKQLDPETCTFTASRQYSLIDSLASVLDRRKSAASSGTRSTEDGGVELQESIGLDRTPPSRITNSPGSRPLLLESCPPWGDPGYASQKTIVRDLAWIPVNYDHNENWFVYNWYCIRDPSMTHTMYWLTGTGWALIAWATPPVYLAPDGAWMETNPWSQYLNTAFPGCGGGGGAAANHQINQLRLFPDGYAIMTAEVFIGGAGCSLLLTWLVSRTYPY
jgi:hypothetical protein